MTIREGYEVLKKLFGDNEFIKYIEQPLYFILVAHKEWQLNQWFSFLILNINGK